MIQYLAFAALAVVAVVLLAVPLLRRPRAPAARAAYDLEVYRDQLRELDSDLARGLITTAQRAVAKREIERRILALDLGPAAWASGSDATGRFIVALVLVVAVPVAAGALYLRLGSPLLPDQPLAERAEAAATEAGDIATLVDGLAERLANDPDDVEGWALLARSYSALGRFPEAVEALRTVARLSGDSPESLAMLAEHIVFAADGLVTPEATALFERVRAAEPGNPAAGFYLGLARQQAGDAAGALTLWTALGRASPPDAPWLADLRGRIAEAAATAGLDPEAELAGVPEPAPAEAAGPTEEDMAAAAAMPAEDQQAMIRGMVEGLAARLEDEPGDLEGWRKLGRAYSVLGEVAKARDVWARASALAPDDADVLASYGDALVAAAAGGPLPEGAVLVYRHLLSLDADNVAALWYLGRAAAEAGDATAARGHWERLRDLLPAGSPERAQVEDALGDLS